MQVSLLYDVSLYPGEGGGKHSRIFDCVTHGWLNTFLKCSIKVSENQFPTEKSNNTHDYLKKGRLSIQSSGLIDTLYLALEKSNIMSKYG